MPGSDSPPSQRWTSALSRSHAYAGTSRLVRDPSRRQARRELTHLQSISSANELNRLNSMRTQEARLSGVHITWGMWSISRLRVNASLQFSPTTAIRTSGVRETSSGGNRSKRAARTWSFLVSWSTHTCSKSNQKQ